LNDKVTIQGLHHASLLISDLERSLAFYQGLLGLELDTRRPDLGYPGAWLWLPDGRQIHLLQLPDPDELVQRPAHGGRDRHLALAIENLDALKVRLEREGIGYQESKSGRRALFCRDPDANALEFVEQPRA
jgi:glyoxylase I family protein